MTSDTLHDLAATFQWSPSYLAQLQHIADTDDFIHEDDVHHQQQLSSSSSAAGASSSPPATQHPGAYDWPVLKDAIKYRIRSCLQESFGSDREMVLHPATKLMPYMEPGEELEVTWQKADCGMLCEKQNEKEEDKAEGLAMPSASVAQGETNGASASATEKEAAVMDTEVVDAAEKAADETQNVTSDSGSPVASAAAQDGDASSPSSDTAVYTYRQNSSSSDPTLTHPPFVHRADITNFYPPKRPLPTAPSTTIQPLSPMAIATHIRTLFSMLDDFDVQPPFTIQRLCELVVAPTAHYNSALKWISALKRCLSVTATRDAFPISPVQAAVELVPNGTHSGENVVADISELEMDRIDGLPPSSASGGVRSRSSSVGSNASVAEPLFSPIPFIVRDENGQTTSSGDGGTAAAGQQRETNAMASDLQGVDRRVLMDQTPDMELGGADRTQIGDRLPNEIVDVGPARNARVADGANATVKPQEHEAQQDAVMPECSDDPMQHTATTDAVTAAVQASSCSTATPVSASAATCEPLGVPDGQVDEIDNPTFTLNPLTSTTNAAPSASVATSTTPSSQPVSGSQDVQDDQDTPRSTKRRKSVASVHDDARA